MNWQIGTAVVLMLGLGSGMLWYERSRPPSQIVALVAVLAALAVAGRIVLAPIPNVVATTDIVFFAGYVLGPAPGFAVGALGGLVSNFWLGQGVWTPWQMMGWGMTGVAGGVLWRITRGHSNRYVLALACGAAGLIFGAWMNFQTMVSYGGEMSLDRYLALEVRAIPFDLAHITGNVIFALIAGPAMVAALRRFRQRFEWQQLSTVAGVMLVAVALVTVVAAPPAQATPTDQVAKASSWLRAQQNDDGGFGLSPGSESSVGMTSRAMIGLAAAEINPLDVKKGDKTPLDYLISRKKSMDRANDLALVIIALKTVGANPRKFEGRDLVEALHVRRGPNNAYGKDTNTAAFAAIAFKSASADGARDRVAKWLHSAQNKDGGWGISDTANSDPDSTGTVLQVLNSTKTVRQAMEYLRGKQKSSGGFTSGSTVNSQSTGLVVQGSVAAGKGPNFLKQNGNSGLDYLLARQQTDGSIWYSKNSDQTRVWVTSDVLAPLAGKALPISQPARAETGKDNNNANNGNGGVTPGGTGTGNTTTTPTTTPSMPSTTPSTGTGSSGSSGSSGKSSSSGNNNSSSGNGSSTGSNPPSGDPTPPSASEIPVVPVAPTEAVLAASRPGPQPSPLVALLICALVSGGLAGGTIWLARRQDW